MTTDPATHKPTKGRSPSYPAIPLGQAIDRARILYSKERTHAAPYSVITGHWGYKTPTSGVASVNYAALKKFGLLIEEGSGLDRRAKLSQLALDILMHPEPGPAIRHAALTPPIHRELWDEYGSELPSDGALRYEFVGRRRFTETGFEEFIRQYKATIAFAGLQSSTIREEDAPSDEDDEDDDPVFDAVLGTVAKKGKREAPLNGTRNIPVPIMGGSFISVEGQFPVSGASWAQFMAVLEAMKPGLVTEDEEA